ncbi:MAG: hypothetical protein AB8B74_08405 [Crocinitomicaceae bacterium]
MKTRFLFLSLVFFITTSCSPNQNLDESSTTEGYAELFDNKYNAVNLNNQISSIQKAALVLVDSVFKTSNKLISKNVDEAIFELDISINRLKELSETDSISKYFSSAVINLLQFYKFEFENDFRKLIPILEKNELSVTNRTLLHSYDKKFVDKEEDLFNEIIVRQDSFAKYFDIELKE